MEDENTSVVQIKEQIKEKLNHNTLVSLYKALIGSILDFNFPCLNSFSESGLQKLQEPMLEQKNK
ncbi:hypothetical protein BpHYR1_045242 [Brachionus plicatilis]|uniref:Uncharacterized protein n=1 Tax=Brachionus plicatilis TaxID=10195 RepID=A0A3M7SGX5_BRAPC|nr:hypothetical protein BpHYR1_045242 [Brachionus plicatilis]